MKSMYTYILKRNLLDLSKNFEKFSKNFEEFSKNFEEFSTNWGQCRGRGIYNFRIRIKKNSFEKNLSNCKSKLSKSLIEEKLFGWKENYLKISVSCFKLTICISPTFCKFGIVSLVLI